MMVSAYDSGECRISNASLSVANEASVMSTELPFTARRSLVRFLPTSQASNPQCHRGSLFQRGLLNLPARLQPGFALLKRFSALLRVDHDVRPVSRTVSLV